MTVDNLREEDELLDYSDNLEEGELTRGSDKSMSDDTLDEEINIALRQEDSERAQELDEKERRCEQLKKEVQKEKNREEEQKRKRLKQMELRFHKLKKTETELSKSQVSSRSSTPVRSPKSQRW